MAHADQPGSISISTAPTVTEVAFPAMGCGEPARQVGQLALEKLNLHGRLWSVVSWVPALWLTECNVRRPIQRKACVDLRARCD